MGAACTKTNVVDEQKKEKKPTESVSRSKTITIGVFGIENSGKTSIIKAIDGVPTDNVKPTIKENTITITEPFVAPENRKSSSNQNKTILRLIDVGGAQQARAKSWEQYYDQIHGWIFVVDTTNRKALRTSQEVLDDLYDSSKLRDKPVLFLLTKQDQKGSYDNEDDFRTDFDIDRFKQKTNIELCTTLPQKGRDRIDPPLRQGVQWLIRTIEDDYVRLNSRVTKPTKSNDRYDSESDRDVKRNSTRLPSIRAKPTIRNSRDDDDDDDDDYRRSTNKTGGLAKRSNSAQQSLAFRASYETFPEEAPWSASKTDEKFPRLTTKSSLTNSTRKHEISPLTRDTKWPNHGSSTKKSYGSDDDDRWKKPQKSRFDDDDDDDEEPRYSSKMNSKRSHHQNDDDDDDDDKPYNSTRMKKVLPKSRFDQGDDDDDDDRRYYSKTQSNRSRSTRDYSD